MAYSGESYQSLVHSKTMDGRPLPKRPDERSSVLEPTHHQSHHDIQRLDMFNDHEQKEKTSDFVLKILLCITIVLVVVHSTYMALKDMGVINFVSDIPDEGMYQHL